MIQTSRSIEFPLAGTTRRTNKGPTQSQLMILFFPSILRYPYHELTYKAVSSVFNATIHRSGLSGLIDVWSFCIFNSFLRIFPAIVFSRGYFIPFLIYFAVLAILKKSCSDLSHILRLSLRKYFVQPRVTFWHFCIFKVFSNHDPIMCQKMPQKKLIIFTKIRFYNELK